MIDAALPPVRPEVIAASVAAARAADDRADALSYLITAAVRRRLAHRMAHAQPVAVAGPWQHSAGDVLAPFLPDLMAKYRARAAAELAAARAEHREPDAEELNRLVALASMEPDTADDLEQRGPAWPGAYTPAEDNIEGDGQESGVLIEREAAYAEQCARETGRIIPASLAAKRAEAREDIAAQDGTLAEALEATGVRMHYTPAERSPLAFVSLTSLDRPEFIPARRRINFFAGQCAQRRASLIKLLTYFLSLPENQFCRMFTFTSGTRWRESARLGNLRAETRRFHDALSRMSREDWFRDVAALLFVGFEFGEFEFSASSWDWHMHLHGHCLVRPHGVVPEADWILFKERCRFFLAQRMAAPEFVGPPRPVVGDDNGRIQDAAEFAKYPVKPVELEKLLVEGGPAAIRRFFEQTFGLRLVSRLGPLAKLAREIDDEGELLAWRSTPDGCVLERTQNHNAGRRPVDHARTARRARMRRIVKTASRRMDRERRRQNGKAEAKLRSLTWRLVRHDAEARRIGAPEWDCQPGIEARRADHAAARAPLVKELRAVTRAVPSLAVRFFESKPAWLTERPVFAALWADTRESVQMWAAQMAEVEAENETAQNFASSESDGELNRAVKSSKTDAEKAVNRAPVQNRIMARLAPFALRGQVAEPVLLVAGYDGNAAALRERPEVAALLAAHGAQLAKAHALAAELARINAGASTPGRARDMKVHTIHATRKGLESAREWCPVAPSRPPGMPAVIQPFLAPPEALADAAAWQSAGRRLAEDPHGYRTEALTA